MERKELKDLGLSDEQIEAVMSKHGELKAKYQDKENDIKTLKSEKKDLEKQLGDAKEKVDKVESLEIQNKEYKDEIEDYKKQLASSDLDKEIIKSMPDAHDIDDVFALLDKEKFEHDDNGEISNFDDVLKSFREGKPHLFKELDLKDDTEADDDSSNTETNSNNYLTNSNSGNAKGKTDYTKLGKELASLFNGKKEE
ncbi:phage scaffolding protein [Staphylococcus xylosus]